MRRIATAALALCLLSGTSALAEPNDHNHDHGQGKGDNGQHNNGANGAQQQHFVPQDRVFQGAPNGGQHNGNPQMFERRIQGAPQTAAPNVVNPQVFERHFQRDQQHDNGQQFIERRFEGNPQDFERHHGVQNNPQVFERRNFRPNENFHPQFGAPGFVPGGARPRYSPQFFPHMFHPSERFHWREGFWRGPPGWRYRTFFFGEFVPFGWFGPDWWIDDYWWYELPVPPWGYAWVRNGPDALLVNIDTGMVVEVVPGIFFY